jgi:hypothetical protein
VLEKSEERKAKILKKGQTLAESLLQKVVDGQKEIKDEIRKGAVETKDEIRKGAVETKDEIRKGAVETKDEIRKGAVETKDEIREGAVLIFQAVKALGKEVENKSVLYTTGILDGQDDIAKRMNQQKGAIDGIKAAMATQTAVMAGILQELQAFRDGSSSSSTSTSSTSTSSTSTSTASGEPKKEAVADMKALPLGGGTGETAQ